MELAKNYILSREVVEKKLHRMAFEILEQNSDEKEIILAGIKENGSVVARRLKKHLNEISGINSKLISIAFNKLNPREIVIDKEENFSGKTIIVIDDVSNSGRTLLYALKPFLEYHPKSIQTLVLVERSHTNFPVRPDYVGLSISTTLREHIFVEVKDNEIIGVYLQ